MLQAETAHPRNGRRQRAGGRTGPLLGWPCWDLWAPWLNGTLLGEQASEWRHPALATISSRLGKGYQVPMHGFLALIFDGTVSQVCWSMKAGLVENFLLALDLTTSWRYAEVRILS